MFVLQVFRQLLDKASATFTYLIGSRTSGQAILVDPVLGQLPLYLGLLAEEGLHLAYVVDTHLHSDHLTAADRLRQATGAQVARAAAPEVSGADLVLEEGDLVGEGDSQLKVLLTPGHTPDSLSLIWSDRILTGDSLLIGDCGSCQEPGSNPGQLFDSVTRRLLPLADELLVFPGHAGDGRRVSCIGEERQNNPRFQGVSRDEFIARALAGGTGTSEDRTTILAANRRCGRAEMPPALAASPLSH